MAAAWRCRRAGANSQSGSHAEPAGDLHDDSAGPDWVCVNGGWLPPGVRARARRLRHRIPDPTFPRRTRRRAARRFSPDLTGCASMAAGCRPARLARRLRRPLPVRSPTPNVPASCQTVQPAPDWACVNGGWLPPGQPLPPARQAASSVGSSGATNFNRRTRCRSTGRCGRGSMRRVLRTVPVAALVSVGLIFTQEVVPSSAGSSQPAVDEHEPHPRAARRSADSADDARAEGPAALKRRAAGAGSGESAERLRLHGSGRHIQGIPALGIPTVRMTNGSTGIIGGDCKPNPVGTGCRRPLPSRRRSILPGPAVGRHPGQRSTATWTPGAARAHGEPRASSLRRAQLPDVQRGSVSVRSDGQKPSRASRHTASTRWRSTTPVTNRKPRGESESP